MMQTESFKDTLSALVIKERMGQGYKKGLAHEIEDPDHYGAYDKKFFRMFWIYPIN